MRLNRELRTRNMVIRFHLLWVLFYVILIVGVGIFGWQLYREHDEDQFPSGAIELKVGKDKYQLNEEITFEVRNNFPTTIYVTNNCPEEPLNIFRWKDEKWIQIHDKIQSKDSECYKQPRRIAIAPNSVLEYHFKDWPNLFNKPGVYRLVMDIDHYDDLPFQDFVVLQPSKTRETSDESNQPATNGKTIAPSEEPFETSDNENNREQEKQEIEDANEIELD